MDAMESMAQGDSVSVELSSNLPPTPRSLWPLTGGRKPPLPLVLLCPGRMPLPNRWYVRHACIERRVYGSVVPPRHIMEHTTFIHVGEVLIQLHLRPYSPQSKVGGFGSPNGQRST
eukprot:GGOE01029867.1.p2 GENE.GGOE01029867.1~~GGOE01029867.1.p2  ORF type:complete len:116 (-),score=8.69 GGOE01029867.1:846-1193(-)